MITGLAVVAAERLDEAAERARADQLAGDFARAQLLPASPARAVRALLVAVAEDNPTGVCSAFTPHAAAELAAAHGATDCPAAVHALHRQVRDPHRYTSPDRASITETLTPDGAAGHGDGCHLTWTAYADHAAHPGSEQPPGPLPGQLDGRRHLGQGYLLTAYRPCP